jgi:RNA polymerase-binding transcription factor DksA
MHVRAVAVNTEDLPMATSRKKITAKPAPKPGAGLVMKSSGKGKPVVKKPAAKPSAHEGAKVGSKTIVKPTAKSTPKPPTKAVAKPPVKPAGKPLPKGPPALNKGAAAAKALAEARAAAAAKAIADAKRPPKLVPATPNAIRPGSAKAAPAKGKASAKPPAEVRPLGVLPPESMAKTKPAPPTSRVVIPARPASPAPPRAAAPVKPGPKGEERLNDDDLKYFEKRLLDHRSRIMGEMGHLESTVLKVNPRDSAGDVSGGYSFHMADAGTDSMEREISFDIASKEGRLLREIDDALRRIYNGVFGICEVSGKPIARARLEALPWARYTVQEQENMERQQRAGRLVKEEE